MGACEYDREQISAYLDGELDARAAEAVEAHLAGCPSCGAYLRTLEQLRQALAQLEEAPPSGLHEAIMNRLRREKRSGRILYFTRHYPFAAVAAMLALVLGLSFAAGRLSLPEAGDAAAPQAYHMALDEGAGTTAAAATAATAAATAAAATAATAAATAADTAVTTTAGALADTSTTAAVRGQPFMARYYAAPKAKQPETDDARQEESAENTTRQELPLMPLPYSRSFGFIEIIRPDALPEILPELSYDRWAGVEYQGETVDFYCFIVTKDQRDALAAALGEAPSAFYDTASDGAMIDPAAGEGLVVLVVPAE